MLEAQKKKDAISDSEKDFILKGILEVIKKVVSAQQYDIWFSCLRIFSITDNSITFVAPNSFIREWLHNHYNDLFSGAVYKVLNFSREVIFSTEDEVFGQSPITPLFNNSNAVKALSLTDEQIGRASCRERVCCGV